MYWRAALCSQQLLPKRAPLDKRTPHRKVKVRPITSSRLVRAQSRLRPTASSPPRRITVNFLGRCSDLRRGSGSLSIYTMAPIRRGNCIGMARWSLSRWTERLKKAHLSFPHMGNVGSYSPRGRQAFVFITRIIEGGQICPLASTAARLAQCTSSQSMSPEVMTARFFLRSKNSSQRSAAAATCPRTYFLRFESRRSKSRASPR